MSMRIQEILLCLKIMKINIYACFFLKKKERLKFEVDFIDIDNFEEGRGIRVFSNV
jgi:hypothetical protein